MKENIKLFLQQNWFKLIIAVVFIIISGLIIYYFLVFIPLKEQNKSKQEELKTQLFEEQINSLKAETEQKKEEAQQQALEEQQAQTFQVWVNSCIVKAQNERDRQKNLLHDSWITCIQLLAVDECDNMVNPYYSGKDNLYNEWEANCKRGIANNF